jgi:hypothetical protein
MKSVKKSNAEIKVLAQNILNEYAEIFYNYEKTHFNQFLGIDVFKVDGSIKQKYSHEKMSYTGKLSDGTNVNASYWFNYRSGYFDIHVKICVNGGSYDVTPATAFCCYDETSITLFKTEDNKLQQTDTDIKHLNRRFDAIELQKIANEIQDAAKVYRTATDKMPYQFRDTFYIERLIRS